MNERTQELLEQCTDPTMTKPWPLIDAEKFAELIVRECMKINRDILCEDDPDYLDQVYKEHFGVEE